MGFERNEMLDFGFLEKWMVKEEYAMNEGRNEIFSPLPFDNDTFILQQN